MDSTGVAFLVSLCKRMPVGSEIVLADAAPIVKRVLELSGLGTLMVLSAGSPPAAREQDQLHATG